MSIKNFSEDEFITVVKDMLKSGALSHTKTIDTIIDEIDKKSSFREVLDISSLEIAELMINLEEKYNIDMEWVQTGQIDCIFDVYKAFIASIYKKRQSFVNRQISNGNTLVK